MARAPDRELSHLVSNCPSATDWPREPAAENRVEGVLNWGEGFAPQELPQSSVLLFD